MCFFLIFSLDIFLQIIAKEKAQLRYNLFNISLVYGPGCHICVKEAQDIESTYLFFLLRYPLFSNVISFTFFSQDWQSQQTVFRTGGWIPNGLDLRSQQIFWGRWILKKLKINAFFCTVVLRTGLVSYYVFWKKKEDVFTFYLII